MSYRINLENVLEYIKLDNEIKAKAKILEAMKTDFIEQMKTEGLEEKTVGNGKGKVTYKNNPQNGFSQKLFGKDNPELLEKYKVLTDCYKLTVI